MYAVFSATSLDSSYDSLECVYKHHSASMIISYHLSPSIPCRYCYSNAKKLWIKCVKNMDILRDLNIEENFHKQHYVLGTEVP